MDEPTSWPEVTIAVTFGFGVLALGTIVLIVVIRTLASFSQARAAAARDDAFRKLAESYDSMLQRVTVAQQSTAQDMAEVRRKVEAMENLMRSVE
jgi:hypothetical protein